MDNSLEKEFPELAEKLSKRNKANMKFDQVKISLEKMELIHKYLRNNTTVTRLALRKKSTYLRFFQNLFNKINFQSPEKVRCEIRDEHCKIISELIKENTTIKELILDHNLITADGINALGLKQNKSLISLSFRDLSPFSSECKHLNPMPEIISFLSSPDCIVENLDLAANFSQVDAKSMGTSLALNKYLTHLFLSFSNLEDSGCEAICEGLKNNSTLTCLVISFNHIGPFGGKSLANILASPKSALEVLDISNNPIKSGMNDIFESLIGNNKLRKLNLEMTGVTSACVKQLRELFQKNQTLSEYIFGDNLGEEIVELIANTLKQNTAFKNLEIKSCGLRHISLTHLIQGLMNNTILTDLFFGVEFVGDTNQIMLLRKAVKNNYSINNLCLCISGWGDSNDERKSIYPNYDKAMKNCFERNSRFQNSDKLLDSTFVGHRLSPEFNTLADMNVEFA